MFDSSDPETARLLKEFQELDAEEARLTKASAAATDPAAVTELFRQATNAHNRKMEVHQQLLARRLDGT